MRGHFLVGWTDPFRPAVAAGRAVAVVGISPKKYHPILGKGRVVRGEEEGRRRGLLRVLFFVQKFLRNFVPKLPGERMPVFKKNPRFAGQTLGRRVLEYDQFVSHTGVGNFESGDGGFGAGFRLTNAGFRKGVSI